jgi:acetolactate synthase-1/2/3 large subunit
VQGFAERNRLPVAASFRRQDKFDNDHPCYVGDIGLGVNPQLRNRVEAADVVLCLGGRLGEVPSGGYEMFGIPVPKQRLIHVHPDPEELGRVYRAEIAVVATPSAMALALGRLPVLGDWGAAVAEARAEYEAWQVPKAGPGRFNLGEALVALRAVLPDDAILTNGAGNFASWLHRFFRYRRPGSQLAPTSGSMGYGVPAAVAAGLRAPGRVVICLAGDGDFMMTGQELATALQYGAAPVIVVVDNGMLGTIRMHQERHYPGRVSATDLVNPDFAALARAYGAHAEYIEATAELVPAVQRSLASGRAALIHVRMDPEALTIAQSLSQIRAAALKG